MQPPSPSHALKIYVGCVVGWQCLVREPPL
jgi:hypothetical protein